MKQVIIRLILRHILLSGNEYDEFYTLQYVYAFGYEVVGVRDSNEAYGSRTKFDNVPFEISFRTFKGNGGRNNYDSEPFLYADSAVLGEGDADTVKDSVYQWKSLCSSRAENVNLAFKVEQADVSKLPIQSYLHRGVTAANTQAAHNTLKTQIKYANKKYQNVALTKYDEVNSFDSFNKGIYRDRK